MPEKQPVKAKSAPKRKAAGTRQTKASSTKAGRPKDPAKSPTSKANPKFHGLTFDDLLDRIASGDSVATVAQSIGAHRTSLMRWLTTPERVDAYHAAQQEAADALIEKAEMAILAADDNVSVARARELANHYRHVAKARNPRRWGDKQQIEMSGELGMRNLTDEQIDAKLQRLLDVSGD